MTWTCPVCHADNSGEWSFCKDCGFDRSCDYEGYPTLSASLPAGAKSVSALATAQQQKLVPGALTCPDCGNRTFYYSTELRQLICTRCRRAVPLAGEAQIRKDGLSPSVGAPSRGVTLACGADTTVAVMTDGTCVAAGDNRFGQCRVGDGKTLSQWPPEAIIR
ncbi:MAG: hypothetical protein LUD82_00905 [Clostridiales bacterium]|nr:hypothetical protein [Clostridiales bacterium]